MEEIKLKNPWLGLESYKEGEVLYGRDDDIRDLSQCVLNDTDTLLYGKSGIGKSSILNAGIIPAARRHGFLPVLVRFSHKEKQTYLCQIKDAIANALIPLPLDESGNQISLSVEEQKQRSVELEKRIVKVVDRKDSNRESLYEFFHRHTFNDESGERIKLLIIFDQFEEIFTLQTDESSKKRFFAELADFLNDVMPTELQQEVTLTAEPQHTRTVIGAGNFGNLFNDLKLGTESNLPEYITDNDIHLVFTIREDFLSEFEYYTSAIPSLKQNRYGLRPINEEQAAQIIMRPMPGLIDVSVAKLIIEKVTGRTDFELDGIPEIEVDSAVLSLYLNRLYDAKNEGQITAALVEDKGGEIIADFYNDAISCISESTVEYLEDMLLNGQARRDNITIFDAINDGGVTEIELDILCNKKKILRQFNYAGDLRIEYVHDILCPVVKAHKGERILLKRQEEEKRRQEEEKQRILLEEKAKRELIEQEAEKERNRLKAEAILSRKRNRHRLYGICSVLLLLTFAFIGYWLCYECPFKTCYATFTTKDGYPVGIGKELSDNDKCKMPVCYQLVKYGYRNKYTRVEVLNSKNELVENKFNESPLVSLYETEGTDEKAKEFSLLQCQTAYWVYTPDNDGNILRKTAYNRNGQELYAIQYFLSSAITVEENTIESQKKQLWANYVDKDGKALRVRDNGADRIRIIVNDSTGYYVGYQFYSETGTPQPNNNDVYGYRYLMADDGRILKKIPVDAFGDLLEEKSTTYVEFDKYGRWIKNDGGQAKYSNQLVVFSLKSRTDSLKFGSQGELLYHSEVLENGGLRQFYYQEGRVINTFHYRNSSSGIELAYSKQLCPKKNKNVKETLVYWSDSLIHYRIKREEKKLKKLIISYYGGDSITTINKPLTVLMPEGQYHKTVVDTIFRKGCTIVEKRFFDTRGELSPLCLYNREIAYYNNNNEMLKHIVYKDEQRVYAYLYEYEDGQIVAQSVLGLDDSTAVRYAGWDKYHLCYYKMKLIYNFTKMLVAVKGINEFDEESLITDGDIENYTVGILPSIEMCDESQYDYNTYGLQVYKVQYLPVNKKQYVEYIHILSNCGTWYKAGVRDGDILIRGGNPLIIARPNKAKKSYDIIPFYPKVGDKGAEYYPVYFTGKEMIRYNNAINQRL